MSGAMYLFDCLFVFHEDVACKQLGLSFQSWLLGENVLFVCFHFPSSREATHESFFSLPSQESASILHTLITLLSYFSLQPFCFIQSFSPSHSLSNLKSDWQHVLQQLKVPLGLQSPAPIFRLDQWDFSLYISQKQNLTLCWIQNQIKQNSTFRGKFRLRTFPIRYQHYSFCYLIYLLIP